MAFWGQTNCGGTLSGKNFFYVYLGEILIWQILGKKSEHLFCRSKTVDFFSKVFFWYHLKNLENFGTAEWRETAGWDKTVEVTPRAV